MTFERYNHLIALMVGAVLSNPLKKQIVIQQTIKNLGIDPGTTDHFIFIFQFLNKHRLTGLNVRQNKIVSHKISLSNKKWARRNARPQLVKGSFTTSIEQPRFMIDYY
jgi:hypothetical protein